MEFNYSFLYWLRPGEWECKEVNQLLRSTQWSECYPVTIFEKAGLPKLRQILNELKRRRQGMEIKGFNSLCSLITVFSIG